MELTPANLPTAAATPTQTKAGESGNAIAGDFETFLTLLTTQLRNQDPLKPMESTEFVAQLASFSSVEQQIRTNDQLAKMLEVLGGGTSDGLALWIGKEVRAPGKGDFAGLPVDVEVTPLAGADRAELVVKNDFDQVVARRTVDATAETLTWDGLDDVGNSLAHGRYGFTLESFQGETLLDSQAGRVFAAVTEVRIKDGEPVLVLEGGSQVALEDVTALR